MFKNFTAPYLCCHLQKFVTLFARHPEATAGKQVGAEAEQSLLLVRQKQQMEFP
jgi:hypothetical protein